MIGPDNVMGLKACGAAPTCGLIEVVFIDGSQEGWVGGGMTISQGGNVQAALNFGDFNYFESFYPFSQMSTFIPVDEGEIDFIVAQPWEYADYCGYLVKDPAGALLVNQNIEFVTPESTFGITACEAGADAICNAEFEVAQITSPDGSPVPGAVQVSIFDYNPNAVYTWDFGDEGTSTDVFPTHQYSGPGPYTLCLSVTDGNLCSDSYCEPISIDSLGILNGFLSGFTINVVDGGPSDVVSSVDNLRVNQRPVRVPQPGARSGHAGRNGTWRKLDRRTARYRRTSGPPFQWRRSKPTELGWSRRRPLHPECGGRNLFIANGAGHRTVMDS